MEGPLIQDFRAIWSWRGRAPRRQYWLAVAFCVATAIVSVGLAIGLSVATSVVLGFGVSLVPLLAGCAALAMTTMRRFQDRNRSPMWMLLVVAPSMVETLAEFFGLSASVERVMFFVVGAPLWTWGVVELGFLRGTSGRNRYGDDPLGPATADTFS